jgi:hypothetical protein
MSPVFGINVAEFTIFLKGSHANGDQLFHPAIADPQNPLRS